MHGPGHPMVVFLTVTILVAYLLHPSLLFISKLHFHASSEMLVLECRVITFVFFVSLQPDQIEVSPANKLYHRFKLDLEFETFDHQY